MEIPSGVNTSHDKSLKRILRAVDKLKRCKPERKRVKYEEIVRYIVAVMHSRKTDVLLQTTALWSLLNMIGIEKQYGPEIMIQAGVPAAIHSAMSSDSLSPHSQKYVSELISILCSYGHSGPSDDMSLQFSLVKPGIPDNMSIGTGGDDSSIGQHSALASFSPYYIDEKNIEAMNQLFDSDGMWKDFNTSNSAMHKLGAALEHDSIDGDENSIRTGHSSLTDFWEAMNKRYDYPNGRPAGPGSPLQGQSRPVTAEVPRGDSITRSRLHEATMMSRTYARGDRHVHLAPRHLEDRLSPYKPPSPKASHFRLPAATNLPTARKPPDAIVSKSLTKLDPLSMNVSTALRTYVQEQRKRSQGIPVGGDDVSVLIEARESSPGDMSEGLNPGQQLGTLSDATGGNDLGHDQDVSNTYFVSRVKATAGNRTRIRAEKLRDMKFLRNFFLGKATLGDTQELINKMQDILELMDKDDTGYVTWKCFGRVLVSLAPKHLLRSDVTAFLDAQVDNEDDLIDYKEFAISGKVLILETKEGVNEVLARSWYSRQKGNKAMLEGDPASAYTWKNHVQWFRKRKAESLIWLMRRANRAIQYYSYVETAQSFLTNIGTWGKALNHLIECGDRALAAIDASRKIRDSLLKRAVHARRHKLKREEARRFLIAVSKTVRVKQDGTFQPITPEVEVDAPDRVFPKLSKIYKVRYQFEGAFAFLKLAASKAEAKMKKKDDAFDFLSSIGQKSRRQVNVHAEIQQVLQKIGERSVKYCCVSDKALMNLLRRGEKALVFFDSQVSALDYILAVGVKSKAHVARQSEAFDFLRTTGQNTLASCNIFENSYGYLLYRSTNAVALRDAKIKAFNFLSSIPRKIFQNEENLMEAYRHLCIRGKHAKKHADNTARAYNRLKTLALRSVAVSRKRRNAYADLRQIGFSALRFTFEKLWVPMPGNKERLKDEIKNIMQKDKRVAVVRKDLPEEERWRAELMDAFGGLCIAFSNGEVVISGLGRPSLQRSGSMARSASMARSGSALSDAPDLEILNSEDLPELGRLGFKKLIMDGKLLGLPKGTADSSYESVDSDASGCVSFDEVWTWFVYQAKLKSRKKPGSVNFTAATILPAKERALSVLMKRFNKAQPKNFVSSADALLSYDS